MNNALKEPYGFLCKSGSYYYQQTYKKYSYKEGRLVSALRTIPVESDKEKRFEDFGMSKAKFFGAINSFNKDYTKQILNNPELLNLKIEDRMNFVIPKRDRNMDLWDTMDAGDSFYEIDVNKAYLQSAFKLGYVSERYYKRYFDRDELKQAFREAVTWLGREIYKTYYNVIPDNPKKGYTIECGHPNPSQRINSITYTNIRYNLHNTILDCLEAVGFDNSIKYNIDAIYVLEQDLLKVRKVLTDACWKFTETKHCKIPDNKYISESGKIRNF